MAKKTRKKRPCSICRKWFQPDVRQIGRQRTCSDACRKELHRRQCEKLNRKNKADSKNNYLGKKIEKAVEMETQGVSRPLRQGKSPVLPLDVISTHYGIKTAVMIEYIVAQIVNEIPPTIHRIIGRPTRLIENDFKRHDSLNTL